MIKLKDIIEGRENWSAEDWSNYHNSLGTAYIKRKKEEERRNTEIDRERKRLAISKILRDKQSGRFKTDRPPIPPDLPFDWKTWRNQCGAEWQNVKNEFKKLLTKSGPEISE